MQLKFTYWQLKASLLLLFSAFGASACRNDNSKSNHQIHTNCIVQYIDDSLLEPTRPSSIGNKLIFIDRKEEHFLHLYDPYNKRVITNKYKIGRGPEEMLAPFSLFVENDSVFWIHDVVMQKMNMFSINRDDFNLLRVLSFNRSRFLYPNIRTDSTIIALNISDNNQGWVNSYSLQGEYLNTLLPFPENQSGLPPHLFMEAYQGAVAIKPDGSKFVLACRYTDVLVICSSDGSYPNEFRTEDNFIPAMIAVQTVGGATSMGQTDETRIAFTDISVTDNYIYCLFSGSSRKERNPTYTTRLFQYNWDGKIVNEFVFKDPIISLSASRESPLLYMFVMRENKKTLSVFDTSGYE